MCTKNIQQVGMYLYYEDYTSFYEDNDAFTEEKLDEKEGVFVFLVFFEAAFTEADRFHARLCTYFQAY